MWNDVRHSDDHMHSMSARYLIPRANVNYDQIVFENGQRSAWNSGVLSNKIEISKSLQTSMDCHSQFDLILCNAGHRLMTITIGVQIFLGGVEHLWKNTKLTYLPTLFNLFVQCINTVRQTWQFFQQSCLNRIFTVFWRWPVLASIQTRLSQF